MPNCQDYAAADQRQMLDGELPEAECEILQEQLSHLRRLPAPPTW